jgi:hypothetical protein
VGPRLYLHIGLQKTGTSYLQRILWDSVDELSRQGVDLVPGTKLAMFRLMLDVRGRYRPEIDPPSVGKAVQRLPDQLRKAQDTALISQESLATATPAQIERLLAAAADREVHVVVTVRDLGRQLPSAWQQTLQSGRSERLPHYLRRLEQTHGTGAKVWANLDVTRVLQTWSAQVPAERITVVTVPPSGSPPRLLLERFCSVIGITPDGLTVDESSRANRSLHAAQAEVLRSVNAALPRKLKRRDVYGDLGKRYFAVRVLGDASGPKIVLPAAHYDWCASAARDVADHIREGGYPVVGDLGDLVPDRAAFGTEATRVSQRVVASTATQALATMLVDRSAYLERRATSGPDTATPGRLRRWARRLRGQ